MELLCCIALLIVCQVSGTPYGYGTKGGAVAKADASAVSGAYSAPAVLPFSIPTGSGFSGSFSKSSSSSFASSSASSSSSSSSFSFSGTGGGHNTFKANNDGTFGGTGCGSGSCSLSGGHTQDGNAAIGGYNPNTQSYMNPSASGTAGATSSAVSSSGAFLGGNSGNVPPCTGDGCVNQAKGCQSGSCNDIQVNNCASGKCGSDMEPPSDIKCESGKCEPALPGVPLSGHNSNSGCYGVNCELNSNTEKPGIYDSYDIPVKVSANSDINLAHDAKHQIKNMKQISIGYSGSDNNCSNGKCGSSTSSNVKPVYELNPLDSYQNPSTQYSTPGVKCDSPNCNSGNFNSAVGHNSLTLQKPATVLSPPNLENGCTSPNCQTDYTATIPKGMLPINNYYDTNRAAPLTNPQCRGNECEITKVPGTPASTSFLGCATGNCNPPSSIQPILYSTQPSKDTLTDSSSNIANLHSQQNDLYTGAGTINCNSPNCSPRINPNFQNPAQPGFPNSGIISPLSPNKLPTYPSSGHTPALAGPISGCTTPNCALQPINKLTGYNKHYPGAPLSCNSPNCAPNQIPTIGSLVNTQIVAGANVPTGALPNHSLSGPISPTAPFHSTECKTSNCDANIPHDNLQKQKPPPYTGGFGGPVGLLKPNEFSPSSIGSPSTAPSLVHTDKNLPTYTGGFGAPSGLLQPVGSVSVPSSIGTTGTLNSGDVSLSTGSYTNTKPIHTPKPFNDKSPSYSSGSDGPAGLLKPIDFNAANGAADSKNTVNSGITDYNSQTHLHSSTSYNADASKYAQADTSQAFDHSGVNAPLNPGLTGVNNQNDKHNKNDLPYTGGFHAPSGLLKPNDYSSLSPASLNKLTDGASNLPCSLGKCGAQSNPSGQIQTQNSALEGSQVGSLGTAKAEAVAYTGSFGGPPGLLKPYDDGKLHGSILGGKSFVASNSAENTLVHQTGSNEDHDTSKVASGTLSSTSGQIATGNAPKAGTASLSNGLAQAGAASGSFSAQGLSGHSKYHSHEGGNSENVKPDGGCNGACGGTGSLAGAQSTSSATSQVIAEAQASANAGAFSGGYAGLGIQEGQPGAGAGVKTGGCGSGCGGTLYPGSNNLGYNGADYNSGFSTANAKSVAGARGFGGFGGSYSSSSASSHASSGFPTKGGYGKR